MMAGGGSVEAPARKARIDVWLFKPMDSRAGENVVFLGLRSEAKGTLASGGNAFHALLSCGRDFDDIALLESCSQGQDIIELTVESDCSPNKMSTLFSLVKANVYCLETTECDGMDLGRPLASQRAIHGYPSTFDHDG
ncbi:hypothetical protein AXG93_2912s1570 [Marchantia polymorpha subsp. ruderalis]|uniref:Uncharacterized protein n=1 Tax=Marchantia polymorpha subsp. ruderalis TaxID=1480154 RepID=A0A176WGB7_MARPO|nr:hypothetical protein AXG93_2912s1570 [Marchantia polymorpha subsp. ruderalis]